MTPDPKAAGPRRSLWRRWLVEPIVRQLTQGITPGRIAFTIAIGSALALFPILGTTTALCAVAGVALGLNQGIIQGVNALCFVVYFPLIVAFVRFGDALAGSAPSSVNVPAMVGLLEYDRGLFLRQFGVTALHAVIGWAAVAPLWVALVYLAALPLLRAAARRVPRRAD
jgi:uncharacterized protein (DUF2062 family)